MKPSIQIAACSLFNFIASTFFIITWDSHVDTFGAGMTILSSLILLWMAHDLKKKRETGNNNTETQ